MKQDVNRLVLWGLLVIASGVAVFGTKKWSAISMESRIAALEQRMTDDTTPQDGKAMSPASTGSTGHTPGPWVVGDTYAIGRGLTIHQHGHWVRLAEVRRVGPPTQLDLANARLIAAAPELLAALKRQQANILRWLETGVPADAEESKSISEQIDAAIKLAEDGR